MTSTLEAPFPWQQTNWQRLRSDLETKRIGHALFLSGPKGLGKKAFAEAFCKSVLCEQSTALGACKQCKNCQLLTAGSHPDFHVIGIEEKAQAIKIDQIRELVNLVAKTPQIATRQCVIIEPADCLNINAANALLKLLEEPQGETIIVLVSAFPQRIPATIRSRCQLFPFAIPKKEQALSWLEQVIGEEGDQYLSLAKGAPLLAAQLFEEEGYENYQALSELLEAVMLDKSNFIDAAAELASKPDLMVIDAMLDWVLMSAKSGLALSESGVTPISHGLTGLLNRISQSGNTPAIFRFHDKLLTTKAQLISSSNPNRALLWEECLLDWQALIRVAS